MALLRSIVVQHLVLCETAERLTFLFRPLAPSPVRLHQARAMIVRRGKYSYRERIRKISGLIAFNLSGSSIGMPESFLIVQSSLTDTALMPSKKIEQRCRDNPSTSSDYAEFQTQVLHFVKKKMIRRGTRERRPSPMAEMRVVVKL